MIGIGSPDDVAGCSNSTAGKAAESNKISVSEELAAGRSLIPVGGDVITGGSKVVIEISSEDDNDDDSPYIADAKVDVTASGSGSNLAIDISSDEEEDKDDDRTYSVDVEARTVEEKRRDDDECCILDSDPFAEELEKKLIISRLSYVRDQDITVVAERGEVACRDFPHSRHLCGEYPFSKSNHESCCPQCYCYVCDVVAPCKYWMESSSAHCNASDMDIKWKDLRGKLKDQAKY